MSEHAPNLRSDSGRGRVLAHGPRQSTASLAAIRDRGDSTLLSAAILALKPFTEAVIVVASRNADQLAPIAARRGASIAINPDPDRGQFSSIQIGLRAVLDCGCDAAMLTPVDCPPLSVATLEFLRESFVSALARGIWAVAPENNGRRGIHC